MSYSEYRDLMPVDNIENGGEYLEALKWAFQNKRIRNIALTGPYGSGKSSIIESFLTKDEEERKKEGYFAQKSAIRKKALKISMATFLKADCSGEDKEYEEGKEGKKDNRINIGPDEVEKGILKQLFYKVRPEVIPQSRYRKLHAIKELKVFLHILGYLILILFFGSIFNNAGINYINEAISVLLPDNVSILFVLLLEMLLLLLLAAICTGLYIRVISKFRVTEIRLPNDTTVQNGSEEQDSVFNRNLDEIIYFFEATGYRIVFFEDLDRLSDPTIFVHLRELNNLLNNDDAIAEKPIVFVYAVRDDIFTKEDRTKFFDFIIPVIPVINSTNSGEILLQRLQEAQEKEHAHEITQKFVLDVSPFISDMRVLQNIYNEFIVYKKILSTSQQLSLSDEQMFAMMIFKNLCPGDFSDIQDEKGIIKKAFRDKEIFLMSKRKDIQEQIDNYSDVINNAENDAMRSITELKYAMITTLMGEFGIFEGFATDSGWNRYSISHSESEIMKKNYDLTNLSKKECGYISYSNRSGRSYKQVDAETFDFFLERWRYIKEKGEKGLVRLQEELEELREQQYALAGKSMKELLEIYSTEEVLSNEVRNNRLLTFMLRRGYIDEKYVNYINYFKGTSVTKDDMNFILSVKNQNPLKFDFKLTKTSMVIERLQNFEFRQRAIYNFDLLNELLLKNTEIKLETFLTQLADGSEDSWKFIDEFFGKTEHLESFIKLLAEKWSGMWAHIVDDKTLTYDRQLEYLKVMIKVSAPAILVLQNENNCLTLFFQQHEDILQKLNTCETSTIINVIKHLNVRFSNLQIQDVAQEVLDYIFDGCFYSINDMMLKTIVSYKNNSVVDRLEKQPYTVLVELGYLPVIQYIQEDICTYVQEIVLKHDELSDEAKDVIDLLKRLKGKENLQLSLIGQENIQLDNILDCAGDMDETEKNSWKAIWDALLNKNAVTVNWENVISYWKTYELSNELLNYIIIHVGELAVENTDAVEDDFVRELICSHLENEVARKLIPVLRMDNFNINISAIDISTLFIMIDCHYFEFSSSYFNAVLNVSLNAAIEYILKNQEEYMGLRSEITMSAEIMETLLFESEFRYENKVIVFSEYGALNMTEKIANNMHSLRLPVTEEIFDAAWLSVEPEKRENLLLENCKCFSADALEKYFGDIGGLYAKLSDRIQRHNVNLPVTEHTRALAEHLKEIEYITSWEETTEAVSNASGKKKERRNVLKLRIRPVQ